MSLSKRFYLAIAGLIGLVLVSALIILLFQEDRSFSNPLVISLTIISILWIAILILSGTFLMNKFLTPIQELIVSSAELAEGNTEIIIPLSDDDDELSILNYNLELIRENIDNAAHFATETGKGQLDIEYDKSGENDQLGSALLDMREQLKQVAKEDKEREWFNKGVAEFSDILRRNNDNLELLSSEIIRTLVNKIEAQQGTLFIKHETDGKEVLEKSGTYAYGRDKFESQTIEYKEGMVGQVWAEEKASYIENVPDGYSPIASGLGEITPKALYIVPLSINSNVMGIIEIASLNSISELQKNFVLKISESIASTLESVQTNVQTIKLLEESQHMQKEMSNQEEMMKQSIEEMRATQEQMQDQESELKQINLDIKENQRQLESRINILNEMCLVSVTDKKGVITEVNGKFLDIAKYSEEELIGKPHNIVRHPDMPAEVFKLMWSTIGKGQSFRGMVKNKAKDGSAYWVDAVINPIIGDDGKPVGYIGVRYLNTDIIQKHPTYTYDLGDVQLTIPTA